MNDESGAARSPQVQHFPALDGLRGVAILLVLAFHLYRPPLTPAGRAIVRFTQFGGAGVNLFFVLSGFLVTGILLRQRGAPGYFKNFYARRVLRIFPLYYAALTVIAAATLVLQSRLPQLAPLVRAQPWLWTYTNNVFEFVSGKPLPIVGHFWSLAVEEQFYLLWPIVVAVVAPRGMWVVCGVCVAIAIATRASLLGNVDYGLAMRLTPWNLDALAVGAALALWFFRRGNLVTFRAVGSWCVAAWCAWVVAVALRVLPLPGGALRLVFDELGALAFGGLLVLALDGRLVRQALQAPWLRACGHYSYGIYVLHWPLHSLVALGLQPVIARQQGALAVLLAVLLALAEAGLTFVLARASFRLFESRFLSLKRYFEPQAESQRAAAGLGNT